MTAYDTRHHYDATFHGHGSISGDLACPKCGGMNLRPTGHARPVDSDEEYGPRVAVTAVCECGEAVEILMGNYKGDFGMDVVVLQG